MLDIKLCVLLELYLKNIYSFFEQSFQDALILRQNIVFQELYHKIFIVCTILLGYFNVKVNVDDGSQIMIK